jgi:menaquinone-dependent protoporphyrinogen oxidase
MDEHVLVTYASKHGATAEIAEKIGAVLREAGLTADVLPVERIEDLHGYTAVVLGSAVYVGKWIKEAAKFLDKNEQFLAQVPVWLFSSGPTGEGDPVELLQGWQFPEELQEEVQYVQPQEVTVFHGDLQPDKLSFLEKSMIKMVKAPVGDFRDWEAITAWAREIATALKEELPEPHQVE